MSEYVRSVWIPAKKHRAMTVGEVIDALRQAKGEDGAVNFALGGLVPDGITSYRGSYDLPALGWKVAPGAHLSPHKLADEIEESLAYHHTGWKGGEFIFTRRHVLCVDETGVANSVVIEAAELIYDRAYVVLHTRKLRGDEGYPHDIQAMLDREQELSSVFEPTN